MSAPLITQSNRAVVVSFGPDCLYRKSYNSVEGSYRGALRLDKKFSAITKQIESGEVSRYAYADYIRKWVR